jgi:hypothetical protein
MRSSTYDALAEFAVAGDVDAGVFLLLDDELHLFGEGFFVRDFVDRRAGLLGAQIGDD